jgi:hypothetical protein
VRSVLLVVSVATVLVLAGGAGAESPTLFGTVGPGFSIRLADASGNSVTNLAPGTYTIQVDDKADIHDFHLTGPGVDMATGVEQVGTVTWTVTLAAGTYHFQCDPHASTMNGDFTVGTPTPATTTTAPPAPPAPKPIALTASVGPGSTISLKPRAGRRLVSLKAGTAVIRVSDRSAKDNFHLIGPGVNRATSRPGKPTVTWRVTFRKGVYRYRSDATPTLRGSFVAR